MRRSSCRSKSFEREAEGERKLNRVISRERERRWRRKETSQNISGEINKKWSKWEYVGSGLSFFLPFNGVAVSSAKELVRPLACTCPL